MNTRYFEISSRKQFECKLRENRNTLSHCVFQSLDLTNIPGADSLEYSNCLFLGCQIPETLTAHFDTSCLVFSNFNKPFNTFPNRLYDSARLYAGYDYHDDTTFKTCYDSKVYHHYLRFGKRDTDFVETLARSLHDHSISDALYELIDRYDEKMLIGIMGGHAKRRDDSVYRQIMFLSKQLTEMGRLMVTGGGPGAMEATHLGAWMAGRSATETEEAISMLMPSPTYHDAGWLSRSFQVMERFPLQSDFHSLAIPTWYYGHEPTAPFATDIAKYFDNSVREDGIVTIAKGGIIYTPGSAGTMQEIFQDAAQNHYESVGYASPMVFLGKDYYTHQMPAYSLLKELSDKKLYHNMKLTISDDNQEIVEAIVRFCKL